MSPRDYEVQIGYVEHAGCIGVRVADFDDLEDVSLNLYPVPLRRDGGDDGFGNLAWEQLVPYELADCDIAVHLINSARRSDDLRAEPFGE
jgi:hypothetical protein